MKTFKLMNFLKKYYYIYLPILITLVTVLFLEPWYDLARDDITLESIVHSAEDNPNSEYLVFIHFIFGYIMRFATLAFPTLNIYAITLVFSLTLAFSVFFYNTRKYNNKCISIFVITILQIYMICGITFTVVAFVCCAAGIMATLDNVNKLNKKSIVFFVVSFILIFIGLSFRRSNVVIAIFLLFVPMSFFAVKNKRITLSALLVLMLIFTGTNLFIKTTQKIYVNNLFEGTDYLEFNRYRGIATDSGTLSYNKNKELFDANGISRSDVDLCKHFLYNDKFIMPTEKLKVMAESFSFNDKYTLNPISIVASMAREVGLCVFAISFSIISIINFIINKKNRKEIFLSCFFVFGAILYLYIRKRGVVRVVKPIMFIGYMQMLNIFLRGQITVLANHVQLKRFIADAVIISVVLLAFNTIPNKENMGSNLRKCLEYVKNDSEYMYAPFNSIRRDNIVSFKRPETLGENIITGVYVGWMGHSPYWYSNLEKYGIEKYKDCIYLSLTDKNVKVVCGNEKNLQRIIKGLEEHHNTKIELKKEKSFGSYFICTLREKDKVSRVSK